MAFSCSADEDSLETIPIKLQTDFAGEVSLNRNSNWCSSHHHLLLQFILRPKGVGKLNNRKEQVGDIERYLVSNSPQESKGFG